MNVKPLPGDFGVIRYKHNKWAWLIGLASYLYDGNADYDHAFIVVDDHTILEAQPGGSRLTHVDALPDALYSTINDALDLTPDKRAHVPALARVFVDIPYGWWDYVSLVLYRLRIRPKFIRDKVNDGHSMICSALVDDFRHVLGSELFDDGRLFGDVTPGDLGRLIVEGAP